MKRLFAATLVLIALCLWTGMAEDPADPPYMENEWNYVDASMDISGGIPEDAEGALKRIRDAGVLRVGTNPEFAPQEFIDPSLEGQARFIGSDMALARYIAERMGVELEIVSTEFTQVIGDLADLDYDLAISALSYIPQRAEQATLSKGYYFEADTGGSGLLIQAGDADTITGLDALARLNIAAESGSLQEALTAQNVAGYKQFIRPATITEVYEAVESGLADAAVVHVENARNYIVGKPDCGLILVEGVRFTMEPQFEGDRVAAKKGEYQLIAFVNGVIDEIVEADLYTQWYDEAAEYARKLGM